MHLHRLSFIKLRVQQYLQSLAMAIREIEGTLKFGIVNFGKVV